MRRLHEPPQRVLETAKVGKSS